MDPAAVRSGLWGILCQDQDAAASPSTPGDVPPIYEPTATLSRSDSLNTSAFSSSELPSSPPRHSTLQRSRSFLHMDVSEAYTFTYELFTGNILLQVVILVEPDQESDRQNHYTFSLSIKIGPVERAISKPVTMHVSVDPRSLDFVVFAFPPRSSLPSNSLHHLRVWLRTPAGVDHRIFGEQDLWFGKDPDFGTIPDASFASVRHTTQDSAIYQSIVGRAHVNFIVRWKPVEPGIYAFALDYEAGGVGKTLFENYHLRLACDPLAIGFLIYSIPVSSNPPGASHRLRFWIRAPLSPVSAPSASSVTFLPSSLPSQSTAHPRAHAHSHSHGSITESYLYQRLWKSDEFKVGAHLSFEAVGSKIVLATRVRDPGDPSPDGARATTTVRDRWRPLAPNRRRISRLVPNVGVDDAGEYVDDR